MPKIIEDSLFAIRTRFTLEGDFHDGSFDSEEIASQLALAMTLVNSGLDTMAKDHRHLLDQRIFIIYCYCFSAQFTIARKPASTSSSEAAMVMRTKPSPCSPKAEPGTSPTPASSRRRSQISSEVSLSGRKSRKK